MVMDVRPLIPSGMTAVSRSIPNVLYQFKIANTGVSIERHQRKHRHPVHGRQRRNRPEDHALRARPHRTKSARRTRPFVQTGTFGFNKAAMLKRGIQVFVGPRRDPFFFDLVAVLQDHSGSQLHEPAESAAGDGIVVPFRKEVAADHPQRHELTARPVRTSASLRSRSDLLAPYNVISIVIEMPKKMLAPPGGKPGPIALWATTATSDGQAE